MQNKSIVYQRQQPLIEKYRLEPESAFITDQAIIEGKKLHDPFHTTVSMHGKVSTELQVGLHRAVGGLHDLPNPGDILCASLASCFETTLRMIANRLGIPLKKTRVKATAQVDVRGTLLVSKEVTVGFQSMDLYVELQTVNTIPEEAINKLIKAAEYSCVVYQTLKKGIPIRIHPRNQQFELK